MKELTIALAALAGTLAPAFADAAELRLQDLVAQVRVIPEARSDFTVSVSQGAARLPPIRMTRTAEGVVLDGGLHGRLNSCGGPMGIRIKDGPRLSDRDLPQVVVHAPLDFAVRANGYINGQIGDARSLNLKTEGCGHWNLGDTSSRLAVSFEGLGHVQAGRAHAASLALEGLGGIDVVSVSGPVSLAVEGMGGIKVHGGRATSLSATLDGMGHISFDGVADALSASASGMGSIRVAEVRGPVQKSQDGFAKVRIGR